VRDNPACARGLEYLRSRQREGTWDEPEYTGTGFPGDFYINYHLYRHIFPTLALAAFESDAEQPGALAATDSANGHRERAALQSYTGRRRRRSTGPRATVISGMEV
jgi:hypothetical protein